MDLESMKRATDTYKKLLEGMKISRTERNLVVEYFAEGLPISAEHLPGIISAGMARLSSLKLNLLAMGKHIDDIRQTVGKAKKLDKDNLDHLRKRLQSMWTENKASIELLNSVIEIYDVWEEIAEIQAGDPKDRLLTFIEKLKAKRKE